MAQTKKKTVQSLVEKIKLQEALQKKRRGPNRNRSMLDQIYNQPQKSGSYDGSVEVGDIQPVGYSETGPNIGPTGTSDAPPIFQAQKELRRMSMSTRKSDARKKWDKIKRSPNSKLAKPIRKFKPSDEDNRYNLQLEQNEEVRLDNIAKIEQEQAKKAGVSWHRSGFIGIATDLGLKYNPFDKEGE
jgi:hypothetical protein